MSSLRSDISVTLDLFIQAWVSCGISQILISLEKFSFGSKLD